MIDAIYKLYPSVVYTIGDTAYDADDNEVFYDKSAVEAKFLELQAAEKATQQAKEASKTSALAKLSALGLTQDEINALVE